MPARQFCKMADKEFVKGDSTNLPKMDTLMILAYMGDSNKHNAAEIRGAKALMSSRTSYLDTCVGYVEVRRMTGSCTVRAKVAPEHRIRNKPYSVTVIINEDEEQIIDSGCDGCAAALGGCKHSLVVLFWLSKRTSEPACTSVTCYWKKPRLLDAKVEPIESKNIFKKGKKITLLPKNVEVLHQFEQECRNRNITGSLVTCFNNEKKSLDKYNLFDMTLHFVEEETDHSFVKYKNFIDDQITKDVKEKIQLKTINQSASKLWHNLRQGRITASQVYDAAHCNVDGSLVQQILGGYKVSETAAIKRGKTLENEVVSEVEKIVQTKIHKSGFILINGLIGASPDGVSENFVVEVKCPSTFKTLKNYIVNGEIKPKFKAQICLQMLAANKKEGLFCVADPKFENNKKVYMHWIALDGVFMDEIIDKATSFWSSNIFPKLVNSAKF